MKTQLELIRTNRKMMLNILDKHSLVQLNTVPEGFKNNLIWNVAHVVVTQQLLVYKLSGLPMMISDDLVALYKKGTQTVRDVTEQEVEEIKTLLTTTVDKTEAAIDGAVFKTYTEYPTSTGFVITSIEDAMSFNTFHEGIHLGYMLALKKAV